MKIWLNVLILHFYYYYYACYLDLVLQATRDYKFYTRLQFYDEILSSYEFKVDSFNWTSIRGFSWKDLIIRYLTPNVRKKLEQNCRDLHNRTCHFCGRSIAIQDTPYARDSNQFATQENFRELRPKRALSRYRRQLADRSPIATRALFLNDTIHDD